MAMAVRERLSEDEQHHWSARRGEPGTRLGDQIQITWDALKQVRASVSPHTDPGAEQKVSTLMHVPIPVEPVQHLSSVPDDADLAQVYGFADEFNVNELEVIFGHEIRSHDNDGSPLSVYFGPTRIEMLADVAIYKYGQDKADVIQQVAGQVIGAYLAKFD